MADRSTHELYESLTQFEQLLECNFGILEEPLNPGDFQESLCDAVAAALAAGANDKAIMDFLLSASSLRADGHAVMSKAGRSWVSKYMMSMTWKRQVLM